MTFIATFILALWFQQQAPPAARQVAVVLTNGQKLVVTDAEFSGFIQGPLAEAVLIYKRQSVHGKMPASLIARIDFGEYRRDQPFALTVTLRNGQKVEVENERFDFVTLRGVSDLGAVYVKHPDPTSAPLRISTKQPDRRNELTIRYLEFP
jgi:hypothetical protein